jgi:hypothetical protein
LLFVLAVCRLPVPRVRAALPVARVDVRPVILPIISITRPAIRSNAPSVLLRLALFIALLPGSRLARGSVPARRSLLKPAPRDADTMRWTRPDSGTPGVMPSRRNQARSDDDRGARYREAAEAAIGQLDWIINYLRRIHKPQIAKAQQQNRDTIVSNARR